MKLIQVNDMDLIKSITNLGISPDGGTLAFCMESSCIAENCYHSCLCTYEIDCGRLHRLAGCCQIKSYCFDQNGMLIFSCDSESGRNGLEEITEFWRVDPRTETVEKAFTLPLAHARASLLAGDRFVISAPWDLELERLKAAGDREAIRAHLSREVIVCDEYPYRIDGQGYVNKKRQRIYEYNISDCTLRPVTPSSFQTHDYAINGGRLYILGEDYEVGTAQAYSVYCWDGVTFSLCAAGRYMFTALAASDGKVYASTGTLPDDIESYVFAADEGSGELKAEFKTAYSLFNHISTDISGGSGREFLAVGGKLYYTMQNRKGVFLYLYDGGCVTRISPEGVDILHFTVSGDGRVFAAGLPAFGSAEVFEILPDRADPLTSFGETELGQFDFVRPEHLVFTGSDGCEMDGWVVSPAHLKPGKRYPAILNIHGGPQLRFYGGLNFTHQLWAAEDYYVLYCNPHGSIGDTAHFSNLRQKYGTVDYDDIMLFTNTALKQYPAIDEKRMGVTGISYGGFMSNWIITRSSRFAAAVSQSGISDWISLHATDDLPGFDLTITGSMPWESIQEHWRISPLAYAGNCKTPTLFIECGEDYRCPVEQGLAMFQSLLALGVPARAVIIRGETHCVFRLGRPLNRLRIFSEIMDWFHKYIPGTALD